MTQYITKVSLCITAIAFLIGCSKPGSDNSPDNKYDTSFSINTLSFPDSEIQQNSILSEGNLYRLISFIKKARSGDSLTIGFIGGSITQGAFATNEANGYTKQFQQSLKSLFPQSTFSIINAGVGATNSRFGSSRVQTDLLISKPDLIIIEFAVNDNPYDSILTTQSIEGLIRQCLHSELIPVIMLFTMENNSDTTRAYLHSIIGRYYSLPIISYRNALRPLIESGQIPWSTISKDEKHPNDKGHKIIGYLLYSFIKKINLRSDTVTDKNIPIPIPYTTDLYEFSGIHSMTPDDPIQLKEIVGWTQIKKEKSRLGYTSSAIGDMIVFTTSAKEVTIGYHFWKNLSGRIEIELDGKTVDTLYNHFVNDWGPGYLELFQIYKQTSNSPHTIRIKNLDNSHFDIQYILYAK